MISIGQIIAFILCTIIAFIGIFFIARNKRRLWDGLKCGDRLIRRKPDGTEEVTYVMAVDKENKGVCLHGDGWISMKDFLLGKNEYYSLE